MYLFCSNVRPHVSKLDPKSLKCIFLGYFRVQKEYKCYYPNLREYLVYADVTFLENAPFSLSLIHISREKDDDLPVYTIATPRPALVPTLVKHPITQVYTGRQNSLV